MYFWLMTKVTVKERQRLASAREELIFGCLQNSFLELFELFLFYASVIL